jgi:hypothetical protein
MSETTSGLTEIPHVASLMRVTSLFDVRPKILPDEDHAGRAELRGDVERSGECGDVGVGHHRRWDGGDVAEVQGDGVERVSGCGEGE